MEFNEKLQQLRIKNGLTQQQLADKLYVSRAAVSKWESGRGYPSIDSLKLIADFFSTTVDELITGTQVLAIAEENKKQVKKHFRDTVFGLIDICMLLLLFLPLFASKSDGIISEVPLIGLYGIQTYLKILYFALVISSGVLGILTLVLINYDGFTFNKLTVMLSLSLGVIATLLFVISLQPYAATFAFAMLSVKVAVMIKRP